MAHGRQVALIAAGSLQVALGEVATACEAADGISVTATFGPSGLMRRQIEAGDPWHVFASADMTHPTALMRLGLAGPVALFARNTLCAIARTDLDVATATLLDTMLDPAVRVGTATPEADPSGDYAVALFDRAEAQVAGAAARLKAKSLPLTGGPASEPPPAGRDPYAWMMTERKADLFLTYRTNAILAQREVPGLRIVPVPAELAVDADYGLTVRKGAPAAADRFAQFILSSDGQRILAGHGFATPTP